MLIYKIKPMFEYAKVILPNVRKELFQKELIKCINWLEPQEYYEFKNWCYANFKEIYPDILEEVFSVIAA